MLVFAKEGGKVLEPARSWVSMSSWFETVLGTESASGGGLGGVGDNRGVSGSSVALLLTASSPVLISSVFLS